MLYTHEMTEAQKTRTSADIARHITEASFLKTCARDWVNPFLSRNIPIEAVRGLMMDVFERMAGVTLTPEHRALALGRMNAVKVLETPVADVPVIWKGIPELSAFADALEASLAAAAAVDHAVTLGEVRVGCVLSTAH